MKFEFWFREPFLSLPDYCCTFRNRINREKIKFKDFNLFCFASYGFM